VELATDRENYVTRTGGSRNAAALPANRTSVVRASGKPRAMGWILPLLAKVVGVLVLTAVVAMGLLYVRLLYGPMALNFLVGPIESAIAEELAGPKVQIENVALGLNDRGLFQFELKNLRVTDAGGETLVAAPSVAVSLSRRAMLGGRIGVESLDLISARLVLFYADDGTLSLKFSHLPAGGEIEGPQRPSARAPAQSAPTAAPLEAEGMLGRIDLVKALSEASARARRGDHASAYLREIGLRSATVIIDNGKRTTTWRVPEFDLDLDHRRTRSSVAGRAKIESVAGPWELTFRSYQHINAKALNLSVAVQGLVPRGLAHTFPHLLALEGFDLPISGDARLELSSSGEILTGKIAIEAAAGDLALPGPSTTPMRIGGGRIELTYSAAARSFEIGPSSLSWINGHVKFTGAINHTSQGTEGPRWNFEVKSTEGWVGGEVHATQPLPIQHIAASGFLAPEHGRIVLHRFVAQAGGTEVVAEGEMSAVGAAVQARLEGKIGAMPVSLFKALWPGWLAPATRSWTSARLTRGSVQGGTFKLVRRTGPAGGEWAPVADGDRVTLTLEGSDLEFALVDGWPALEVARGLLRLDGPTVEFSAPEASMGAADGRKFALKGSFTVDLGQPMPRRGNLALKGQGPLSLAIDILDREAPHLLQNAGLALTGSDGKVDGSINISLPLTPQLQLQDVVVEGRLRVSDAKVRQAFGALDVQGINVAVDISASAIEAKGKFLAGNVPATVNWQYVYGAPTDKQPPLRIAATLYENERAELGLDVNDIVQGEIGAEITVAQDAQGERHVHVRADLTNAALTLESLAWHKPVGKRGTFEFDLVKGAKYPIELHNVRLDGENVAIAGWMGAGQDFRIKEYRFPQFSLNVVSNFEAHGKLRSDNVWEVTAKGATYDGRDLFRSFFVPGAEKPGKQRPGLDLRAEFETVLGFFETSLRAVRVSMQSRAGKPTQLDARGVLAGSKQFEAVLRPEPGRPRLLVAKSNDAGQVFKLVGFLPHAVGGDMSLEVNLDGKGAAEKTGLLSATRFHLLGDAVSLDGFPGTEPGGRRRNVVREKVPFEVLRVPFSVGHGQFALHDARLEGPVASATGTGKIDFRTKRLHVVGTFTPVAGLNQIFRDIPLFGDIMTGPKREGVFAWNYALQGGLENPQIVFNPLSGVAPGFTREFFPIMPEEPRTAPRRGPSGSRLEPGSRASSSPVTGPGGVLPPAPDVTDGWLSETDKAGTKKK